MVALWWEEKYERQVLRGTKSFNDFLPELTLNVTGKHFLSQVNTS
jgi:hypothetical protein